MNKENGITPLTDEELAELIPLTIQTREQLNQWEQINIYEASKNRIFLNRIFLTLTPA
jgi:hypothetical protein